jgi:hypothetical protein
MTTFCLNRVTWSKIFRPSIVIHKSTVFALKSHNDYIKGRRHFTKSYLIINDLEMRFTVVNMLLYMLINLLAPEFGI